MQVHFVKYVYNCPKVLLTTETTYIPRVNDTVEVNGQYYNTKRVIWSTTLNAVEVVLEK